MSVAILGSYFDSKPSIYSITDNEFGFMFIKIVYVF
jgi:hypothetical protein